MKIRTLAIHQATPPRIDALLRTLVRHGHIISNTKNADVWFVDCIWPHAIDQVTIDELLSFAGHIVFMSLGDLNIFRFTGLPDCLIDKASGFAKIQWGYDTSIYDARMLGKMITVHPFLIGGLPVPGDKKSKACFFGLPSGAEKTEDNLRIRACRMLKPYCWFTGGIVGQENGAEPRDIGGIEIGHRPRDFYLRTINQCLLSICMPGNSPLTYRMFESLGMASTVISCCLEDVKWLNRLIPGEHYIAVQPDLSNLIQICQQAIDNPVETRKIAQAGYTLHKEYYAMQPDGGLSDNLWSDIKSQFTDLGIEF
jgi:hypothetical protein